MASPQLQAEVDQQRSLTILMTVAGLLLLLGSSWMWWTQVYASPKAVFWGMVDANLRSYGQTRHITQTETNTKLVQDIQLRLGSENYARGQTVITQDAGSDTEATVVSETLGTPTNTYVRYTQIKVNPKVLGERKLDLGPVINVWGKQENADASQGGVFTEAIYGSNLGAVPTAYLPTAKRHELVTQIQKSNAYETNYNQAKKERFKGREAYVYDVSITPEKYLVMLKQFDKAAGLNQLAGLDPGQYAGTPPIKVKMYVDIMNHNLLKLAYEGGAREETYSAFGAQTPIEIPSQTISQRELQEKLQRTIFGL